MPAGRILPPRIVPSRSVQKSLPGCCFPRFFHLCGRFPACNLGRGSLNWGIDTKARGREIPVIDQCVWAGNWDLRESIPEQDGMDFHPRDKARSLPCSVSPQEMLGKLAQAGARDQEFGSRLRLGAGGCGMAAEAGLLAQMAAAWLLRCSMAAPPGRWCAWQILRSCFPTRRQPRRARSRALQLVVLRKGLDAAPEGRARRGLLPLLWAMGQRLISAAREGSFN